jgi:hypothetical protein
MHFRTQKSSVPRVASRQHKGCFSCSRNEEGTGRHGCNRASALNTSSHSKYCARAILIYLPICKERINAKKNRKRMFMWQMMHAFCMRRTSSTGQRKVACSVASLHRTGMRRLVFVTGNKKKKEEVSLEAMYSGMRGSSELVP